jgi:hypothetical protein
VRAGTPKDCPFEPSPGAPSARVPLPEGEGSIRLRLRRAKFFLAFFRLLVPLSPYSKIFRSRFFRFRVGLFSNGYASELSAIAFFLSPYSQNSFGVAFLSKANALESFAVIFSFPPLFPT